MFGQPEPTITITATRTNNIQPDQVVISLFVTSGTTAGLDDITGALTGAGISGANLTQVYTTTNYTVTGGVQKPQSVLVWSFTLMAPLVARALSGPFSQQTISGNNSGLTLTFFVGAAQVSQQLQQSQSCPQAALLADAQAQAKAVATAAGVSAGAILSMSEGSAAIGASLQFYPLNTGITSTGGFGYASLPAVQPTCSLTVQFQLM